MPPLHRLPWISRMGLPAAIAAIALALSIASPNFASWGNLINVFRQISINGILAVGVTWVLLCGGVDLSLGSQVALAGVVAAHFAHPGAFPTSLPFLLGIAAGAACGLANGLVITRWRVAPFVATLGMMTAARGLALVLSDGKPVSNLSRGFTRLGTGDWLGIPLPVLVFLGLSFFSAMILKYFRLGRYVYAVGGNEQAALVSGIRVDRIKRLSYAICGASAGLAGTVLAARITTGQPNAGLGYELDAIAAAVIGGTSLSGGAGGIGGTLLGALLLGILNNGLDLLNVSSYYQAIIKGGIIVGAVVLDQRRIREESESR